MRAGRTLRGPALVALIRAKRPLRCERLAIVRPTRFRRRGYSKRGAARRRDSLDRGVRRAPPAESSQEACRATAEQEPSTRFHFPSMHMDEGAPK
jgi:hypothetical protein